MDSFFSSPTLRIEVATATDTGRVRARNEDAVGADPVSGLLVVADGMGGHPAGHRASALAVQEVRAGLCDPATTGEAALRVQGAILAAHRRVMSEGDRDPACRGMGTTLTILLAEPRRRRWTVGHVGDSRGYLLRDGGLQRITRDQTWVQEEVERGRLEPSAAARHPMANLLLQAVGNGVTLTPEVTSGDLVPGDLFLLCSDGLIRVLGDGELEEMLGKAADGEELAGVADALVEAANRGGAPDNVSVALLRVLPAPSA
jgi:PPM family protein phosphatase